MAGKKSGPPPAPVAASFPVAGLLLGAAGLLILAVSSGIFIASLGRQHNQPTPPLVENSPGEPGPSLRPPPTLSEMWWEKLPGSSLAATVAKLKQILPQEKALFASLGSKSDIVRLDAYQG